MDKKIEIIKKEKLLSEYASFIRAAKLGALTAKPDMPDGNQEKKYTYNNVNIKQRNN